MEVIKTPIEGVLIIEPKVFGDHRGYFFESFCNIVDESYEKDFCIKTAISSTRK